MENSNLLVVKKKSAFWRVVKLLLVVGAVCLVAAKIYQKFFKKKACACELDTEEDAVALDAAEEVAQEEETAEVLEVPAEAVIANAEDMEEATEAEETAEL